MDQWAGLTLADLKQMLRDVLTSGPVVPDGQFIRDLLNEIARREKSGK